MANKNAAARKAAEKAAKAKKVSNDRATLRGRAISLRVALGGRDKGWK